MTCPICGTIEPDGIHRSLRPEFARTDEYYSQSAPFTVLAEKNAVISQLSEQLATLRTTVEQWKADAIAKLIPDMASYKDGAIDAYDKVLRLLAGNAAGEGEGEN